MLRGLDAEQLQRLKVKLLEAQHVLTAFKDEERVASFKRFRDHKQDTVTSVELLGKNLSDEEMLHTLSDPGVIVNDAPLERRRVYQFEDLSKDTVMVYFIGRRALEGGDELIDKYLAVIAMVLEDVAEQARE